MLGAISKQVVSKGPKYPPNILQQVRYWQPPDESRPRPRRRPTIKPPMLDGLRQKSEWWIVDGEIHEIGDNVPVRERFVIPRDNIPNRRRKMLRHQFMFRTRLVIKDKEHNSFCKKYMELYNELRENWERLCWDEGYSQKLARDHANYDSPEEDNDEDFSPYRIRGPEPRQLQELGAAHSGQTETLDKVSQIRDKFEYDREKRMRETAFAPMTPRIASDDDDRRSTFEKPPSFDEQKSSSEDEDD